MSKGNATEVDLLARIFRNTPLPWDAAASFDIHLHTADPGEAGTTTTNEATYAGYAPVNVVRSGAGWSGANPIVNAALLQFPQCTGGSNVITHVSISPAGSTQILYSGALNAPLNVANQIRVLFDPSSLQVTED